jgi:hypothetical protein
LAGWPIDRHSMMKLLPLSRPFSSWQDVTPGHHPSRTPIPPLILPFGFCHCQERLEPGCQSKTGGSLSPTFAILVELPLPRLRPLLRRDLEVGPPVALRCGRRACRSSPGPATTKTRSSRAGRGKAPGTKPDRTPCRTLRSAGPLRTRRPLIGVSVKAWPPLSDHGCLSRIQTTMSAS